MFAHAQWGFPDLNLKLTPAATHHLEYIDNQNSIYLCYHCHCHITSYETILSRTFQGRHGLAYLTSKVVNVSLSVHHSRVLLTGRYTVANVTCKICGNNLGWKYITAAEESQKYKEGRYLIERTQVVKELQWDK